jgi:hypothetical protein
LGERGTVLYNQHAASLNLFRSRDKDLAGSLNDGGPGVVLAHVLAHDIYVVGGGGVHFVDDHHMGAAQIDLPGIIAELMAGTMRIGHHDFQVGGIKGRVIIAAVPQNEITLPLGLTKNAFVIHAGINHGAVHNVGLVFLALFDSALVAFQVFEAAKTLHRLLGQIAIGHGMANDHRLPSQAAQFSRYTA